MQGFYKEYLVETFLASSEQSEKKIRVRPVAGQGLPVTMRVECSSSMRRSHPIGTKFLILGKITDKEGGSQFIYSSFKWKYRVLNDDEASRFLAK